jgi:hypothetical protein
LRQQLITGPKRKKIVIASLAIVCAVMAFLALRIGTLESSLPIETQLDETRLLEPNSIDPDQESSKISFVETGEGQLLDYVKCQANSTGESQLPCLNIIANMLKVDPSNGRLWLEKSKLMAAENGMDDQAIFALKKSIEYSRREGWLSLERAHFALSVWIALPADLQDVMITNLLSIIKDDPTQLADIAELYIANPLTRKGITAVIENAPVDVKRSFLNKLQNNIKS